MNKQTRLLKETLMIKNLSPERAAPFLGCSGRQVRRWVEGKADPLPLHLKAIEAGIRKINREIPGDKNGVVNWRSTGPIPASEIVLQNKLTAFFRDLLEKAGPGGRSIVIKIADENFPGFEEICALASKLKVKLPEIRT